MSVDLKEPSLPPSLAAVATRELGETSSTRRDSLRELRRRISSVTELTELERSNGKPEQRRASEAHLELELDDRYLLRFLRCKKFDVGRSYSVWEGYHRFRRENEEMFRELTPGSVRHVWHSGVIGGLTERDRKGRAVLVSFPGRWDPEEVRLEEVLGALVLQLERLVASEETQVQGIVLVADFEGFSFSQATSLKPWYFQKMTSLVQSGIPVAVEYCLVVEAFQTWILENAFPARFKGVYIVRQPWYLSVVLSLIRPFLSEKMNGRINILGDDLKALHDHFDPATLPYELEGELGPYNGEAWATSMEEGGEEEKGTVGDAELAATEELQLSFDHDQDCSEQTCCS